MYYFLSEYVKADKYYKKAPAIIMEIGDRAEATCCGNLELCFTILVNIPRLKNITRKLSRSALKQAAERVMQMRRQTSDFFFLKHLGEYTQAEEYYKEASAIRIRMKYICKQN